MHSQELSILDVFLFFPWSDYFTTMLSDKFQRISVDASDFIYTINFLFKIYHSLVVYLVVVDFLYDPTYRYLANVFWWWWW